MSSHKNYLSIDLPIALEILFFASVVPLQMNVFNNGFFMGTNRQQYDTHTIKWLINKMRTFTLLTVGLELVKTSS